MQSFYLFAVLNAVGLQLPQTRVRTTKIVKLFNLATCSNCYKVNSSISDLAKITISILADSGKKIVTSDFDFKSSQLLMLLGISSFVIRCFYLLYTVSQKKTSITYNYVKLLPNLTIFGTKLANCLKLYEVHSFSTSSNSCQCTSLLNADVPHCYITL